MRRNQPATAPKPSVWAVKPKINADEPARDVQRGIASSGTSTLGNPRNTSATQRTERASQPAPVPMPVPVPAPAPLSLSSESCSDMDDIEQAIQLSLLEQQRLVEEERRFESQLLRATQQSLQDLPFVAKPVPVAAVLMPPGLSWSHLAQKNALPPSTPAPQQHAVKNNGNNNSNNNNSNQHAAPVSAFPQVAPQPAQKSPSLSAPALPKSFAVAMAAPPAVNTAPAALPAPPAVKSSALPEKRTSLSSPPGLSVAPTGAPSQQPAKMSFANMVKAPAVAPVPKTKPVPSSAVPASTTTAAPPSKQVKESVVVSSAASKETSFANKVKAPATTSPPKQKSEPAVVSSSAASVAPAPAAAAPAKMSYAKMLQASAKGEPPKPKPAPTVASSSAAPAPVATPVAPSAPAPATAAASTSLTPSVAPPVQWVKENVSVSSYYAYSLFRKSRVFLGHRLGVYIDFPMDEASQEDFVLTLYARGARELEDAKDELEIIEENRRSFEQEFEIYAMQKVHIFADNVNLFYSAQFLPCNDDSGAVVKKELGLRIALRKLAGLVEGGRSSQQRVVCGDSIWSSSFIWTKWRESKFEVRLHSRFEEMLVRTIEETINAHANEDRTLVLLTGDPYKSLDRPLLLGVAEKALNCGWQVELWCWKISLSPEYVKLRDARARQRYRMRIRLLDDFRNFVTFIKHSSLTDSAGASGSNDTSGESDFDMLCPITHEVMNEPVITPAGHIYEANVLLDWIDRHGNCPLTRTPLAPLDLAPAPEEFRSRLALYKRRHKLK